MRSIAWRLRSLRTSVHSATRDTSHVSNAWVSSSNLASVLMGERWASAAQPCTADLDLVREFPTVPPAQLQETRASDEPPVGEPALGERHDFVGVAGGVQPGDVVGHPLRRRRHLGVGRTSSGHPTRRRRARRSARLQRHELDMPTEPA